MNTTPFIINLTELLTKEKEALRQVILNAVSKSLKTALKRNAWFMSNECFGVGVFSDGIDVDGKIMEGRCYTKLEKLFKQQGLTTNQIAEEFSKPYLRQFFMSDWITKNRFQYL